MLNRIDVEEALNMTDAIMIDVRSPAEFGEATIPGAMNIPLLEDMERANVGTVYRQESIEKATALGINYASQKLTDLYSLINNYHLQKKKIIIFCWRGGMRSKSVCSFLNSLNLNNVYQLVGGYKAYRKYVLNFLEEPKEFSFIVLHGLTGVGKTHILNELENSGEPVLDLEDLASNSGSVFGNIAFKKKSPSQKMFESYVFNVLYFSRRKVIFVESESKRIGNTQIPDKVYEKIVNGHHVLINTTLENRIKIIKNDYIKSNQDDKIIEAIHNLKKRLGHEKVVDLVNKIHEKNYDYVIRTLIEIYYDPLYKYSIEQYEEYDLILDYNEISDILPVLIQRGKLLENKNEREKE